MEDENREVDWWVWTFGPGSVRELGDVRGVVELVEPVMDLKGSKRAFVAAWMSGIWSSGMRGGSRPCDKRRRSLARV